MRYFLNKKGKQILNIRPKNRIPITRNVNLFKNLKKETANKTLHVDHHDLKK